MFYNILQLGHRNERIDNRWKTGYINENDFAKYFLAKKALFQHFKMSYLIELDSRLMDLFPF